MTASTRSDFHKVRSNACKTSVLWLTLRAGGQFLRAYVERYNSPPAHNLITFGAQHMGVSDIQPCRPFDVTCQLARRAMRNGVYGEWAQKNIIPVRKLVLEPLFRSLTSRQ